ncbi:MFS transporter [Streptomyces sp. NPDC056257]|uniref:MFS transporter n=1 Tax=Streptomyces sp. NPDC056257 TaxID=3345765 RepID=UPI0035DEABEC
MSGGRPAAAARALLPKSRSVWVLALTTLTASTGHGTVVTISVLYFTRAVEIPAAKVGLGLTIAAVVGMAVSIPAGHLADALGARKASIAFVLLQGLTLWGYALVGGFTGMLIAASLVAVAESASNASRGALIANAIPSKERVRTRAYLRSVTNVGFSIGTVLGGLALSHDSPAVYAAELIGGGSMFIVSGLAYLWLADPGRVPKPSGASRWLVLRDRPFAVVGLLNAVLIMNAGILNIALPIWIVEETNAPASAFAALLLVNTVLVVLFQVPMSKGAEDVRGGARALLRSGLWLASCCVAIALAAGRSPWVALAFLAVGVVLHTMGELLYSAGTWALSYELAPDHAQGQYQGMFGLTSQLGIAITPAVTAVLIVRYGWVGWVVLAAVMAAAGLAAPAVARWAERSRPDAAAPVPAAT